jgi:hypothetical protein
MTPLRWIPPAEAMHRMQRARLLSSFYTRWGAAEEAGLPMLQLGPVPCAW